MEASQKCIQSFAPHGVRFLDKAKVQLGITEVLLDLPAGSVDKNIAIVEESFLEELKKDPTFITLLDNKLIRILDNIPRKYEDVTSVLISVKSKLADVQAEKVATDEKNSSLAGENASLRAKLAALEEELATGTKPSSVDEDDDKGA